MRLFYKEKLGNGCRAIYFMGWRICYYKRNPDRHLRFVNCDISPSALIDATSVVGEYTGIGRDVDISATSIGRYCSIGSHIRIGQGEHDLEQVSTCGFLADENLKLTALRTEIGHDVWIGTEAVIRRGVRVGNFAVIGANAFVNKDVPDFGIAVGIPARVVRLRFTPEQRKKIVDSKYWLLPPEEAKAVIRKLGI